MSLGSTCSSVGYPPTIILCDGNGWCKSGFGGEKEPRTIFSSITGIPKQRDFMCISQKDCYVGAKAQELRQILFFRHSIQNNIVTNWSDMEHLWEHSFFDELRVGPEEHPVLVSEHPMNPLEHREKVLQIMFETFEVPMLTLYSRAALALFGSGRTTGLVVESGSQGSKFVPIYAGKTLKEGIILQNNGGGRDLTKYLLTLLSERYDILVSDLDIFRRMKETVTYVAMEYKNEIDQTSSSTKERQYELPDGQTILLRNERFQCPEYLFQECSLPNKAFDSIQKCPLESRSDLFQNIVLSGGNTLFPGLPERFSKELTSIMSASEADVNVVALPKRRNLAWIGGSSLSMLPQFENMFISKEEYDEVGPSLVHSKCRSELPLQNQQKSARK